MKSKSIELQKKTSEKANQNKTYDFVNFYKPCNIQLIEKRKSEDSGIKENEHLLKTKEIVKREHSPNKKKKKFKSDSTNVDEGSEPHGSKNSNGPKITSTPNANAKKDVNANVKSIMKTTCVADNSLNISTNSTSNPKSKKRNKSVSFLLEESEDVIVKRSKSEQSVSDKSKLHRKNIHKNKKQKKEVLNENENQGIADHSQIDIDNSDRSEKCSLKIKNKEIPKSFEEINIELTENVTKKEKKRHKKQKKTVSTEITADTENDSKMIVESQIKVTKLKKKKPQEIPVERVELDDKSGSKLNKKELKPEVIAQDLQNLNIGDNPHTLTNLLDEMAVVDKNKKKKDKKKFKKSNPKNDINSSNTKSKTETTNEEQQSNEEKEKVKWMKRKWNKDKKGAVNDEKLLTSIIIENLPLKIMCNYKKLLSDHFAKFGIIKQVGVAELYSMEDPEVFTTTINFYSEDAAEKSLEENNTVFEGNHIHIKRPMPPTQTTLVVRSYSDLSEPSLSSVFTSAGKIRNVRRLVKGKKSMSTAFIEFDGPEAVQRAIKMAEDVKIGGKKIFVAKFEVRNKSKKQKNENENEENSDDSEE